MADIAQYIPSSGQLIKEDGTIINEANILSNTIGAEGSKYIGDTTATTPTTGKVFVAIQVVDDAVFTTLTGNMTGTITSVSFATGTIIYGRFTAVTLASGKVIAYEGV